MNRITEPTEEGLEVASAALTEAYGLRLEPLKAVKIRIGLSEATVYRLLAAGQFPKAHRRVGKKSLWLSTDVDAWIRGDWQPNMGRSMGRAA